MNPTNINSANCNECSRSIRDFEIHEKLGEGSFSTVFRVTRKSDNKIYALK